MAGLRRGSFARSNNICLAATHSFSVAMLTRTAKAWSELMKRLGYNRHVAQGGDLGAGVTTHMGRLKPKGLAAIHLNFPLLLPPPIEGEPDATEKVGLGQLMRFRGKASGYPRIQKTRPQTLGYGLTDSPIRQVAWIYEKCLELAGDGISGDDVLSFDDVLDDITLYWLTATATSSARLYWESWDKDWGMTKVDIPVGSCIFLGENYRAPRVWARRVFSNLFYWNELDRGGHFAAHEQPKLFVDEMRACFGKNQMSAGISRLTSQSATPISTPPAACKAVKKGSEEQVAARPFDATRWYAVYIA